MRIANISIGKAKGGGIANAEGLAVGFARRPVVVAEDLPLLESGWNNGKVNIIQIRTVLLL